MAGGVAVGCGVVRAVGHGCGSATAWDGVGWACVKMNMRNGKHKTPPPLLLPSRLSPPLQSRYGLLSATSLPQS